MDLNDNQLAALWNSGDQKAYGKILELYKDKIYRLAFRILRNKADSEDVVQETFLRVYLHKNRIDVSKNFSSWIYSIGTNISIDFLRRKKAKTSMDTSGSNDSDVVPYFEKLKGNEKSPEMQLIDTETTEQVRVIITELPAKYRSLIVYKYFLDMSLEEISARVNLPVTTIKTRLFRGRSYIKKKWGSTLFMTNSITSFILTV
ncbi:sigma-70 family RNA polymerase sigma factor [Paenibacillus eucommiae]|uniref:RNA polymerase sigma factor n=1 Tax=Paenibacillus eucommiae TaxID=1355755 RepID=A0ABS4J0X5_9BACL|nr:sigma-70 family RNA polymerase sigma factor [Paenibacillus eucommiae]MBP1993484.1 RNA polymerase sigma-70 factor (ECF subfamily) [Paenibacillus eucommiae]